MASFRRKKNQTANELEEVGAAAGGGWMIYTYGLDFYKDCIRNYGELLHRRFENKNIEYICNTCRYKRDKEASFVKEKELISETITDNKWCCLNQHSIYEVEFEDKEAEKRGAESIKYLEADNYFPDSDALGIRGELDGIYYEYPCPWHDKWYEDYKGEFVNEKPKSILPVIELDGGLYIEIDVNTVDLDLRVEDV